MKEKKGKVIEDQMKRLSSGVKIFEKLSAKPACYRCHLKYGGI